MMSYDYYKEKVMRIYRDMRREAYYYPLIAAFLEECILGDEKVISVYDNKGYSDDGRGMHNRTNYADSNSLQDMIIVSKEYTYEHTIKPYVSIEIKMPDIVFDGKEIKKYTLLKMVKQLQEQFRFCKYIIFSDCITWYFLRADDKIYKPDICLVHDNKWEQEILWENLKRKIVETTNESKQIKV